VPKTNNPPRTNALVLLKIVCMAPLSRRTHVLACVRR
jgi:hypothetical protein